MRAGRKESTASASGDPTRSKNHADAANAAETAALPVEIAISRQPLARAKAPERNIPKAPGRVAGAEKGLLALNALEQSIVRLTAEMAQTRRTPSVEASPDPRRKPDIHERWTARDETDNRIHLALNAMQETIGQLADRLARMDADLAIMRLARADNAGAQLSAYAKPTPKKTAPQRERDQDNLIAAASPDVADLLIEPGAGFPFQQSRRHPPAHALPTASADETGRNAGDVTAAVKQREPMERRRSGASARPRVGGRPMVLCVGALCVLIIAYALARSLGLDVSVDGHGFAPTALKSMGLADFGDARSMAQAGAIRRDTPASAISHSPSAPMSPPAAAPFAQAPLIEPTTADPDWSPPGAEAHRQPPAPLRQESRVFDPAAFESSHERSPRLQYAGGVMAGGDAILVSDLTAASHSAAKEPMRNASR